MNDDSNDNSKKITLTIAIPLSIAIRTNQRVVVTWRVAHWVRGLVRPCLKVPMRPPRPCSLVLLSGLDGCEFIYPPVSDHLCGRYRDFGREELLLPLSYYYYY